MALPIMKNYIYKRCGETGKRVQAKSLKLGDGLDPNTQMGPVVSAAHKERVLGYIEKGISEGADLILDGRNPKVDNPNQLTFDVPDSELDIVFSY